ncbi:MATE family efflux transporter [Ningiella sp. W23]|uniref:MATE family efflux transporter n=1 Tax=Ningiella sp. W23 TaxID=3023715 RepID=UPI0037579734
MKLTDANAHSKLLRIAIPLILANVTTPLLGLVDTAILGRMDGLHFLAGAAIASLILTQLYWICGFIKMSITGLSAQSKRKNADTQIKTLMQGAVFALCMAILILVFQYAIVHAGLWFAQASPELAQTTQDYYYVRVWGAPAALVNLAIIGWLVGQQKSRVILVLQVLVNVINIIASLSLVYGFNMGVEGVAAGTVIAEYSLCILSFAYIHQRHTNVYIKRAWFALSQLQPLLSLNWDMLIRNLFLQFTLAFITLRGVQYGTEAAAINAILMQFFALIALGLDGIANAVEALVGERSGSSDKAEAVNKQSAINMQVMLGLFWSSAAALLYTLIFWIFGLEIIQLLSNQSKLIESVQAYLWVIILLPAIAHWCFLFDGVYVGLTKGKTMRNNMILSTLLGFLPCVFIFQGFGNQSLWVAMFAFLIGRGLGLGLHYALVVAREPGAQPYQR